jgi:hypothetical protein
MGSVRAFCQRSKLLVERVGDVDDPPFSDKTRRQHS